MACIFIAFTLKNSSVAEFFTELANTLSNKYRVVILSHATEENRLQLKPGIEVLNWPGNKPNSLEGLIFLNNLIRKFRPETLIANFSTVNIMMFVGYLNRVNKRIAWYHTLSTQLEKKTFHRWRKRFFYAMATKVICNSASAKEDVIKVFGLNPKKVFVVHNAIRKNSWNSNLFNREQIVYAGRLHPTKGVDILINALQPVREIFPSVKLLIIGDDEGSGEIKKLERLVLKLGLKKNISFLGNRSKEVVLEKFRDSYCAIVPSRAESFGYVVIESFSVGTPVIGTNATGVSEIVRDGIDGFLFKPESYEDLADKIVTLLKDDDLRKNFSINCRNRFLDKFEVEKVISRFASEHV